MNDWELLNQYVERRSEEAFGRVVELHAGMVHAVCRRQLRDAHLAEDATQAVFMVLAARAKSLRAGTLAGWLHQTARHVAARAARGEENRRRHERIAAGSQSLSDSADEGLESADLIDQMLSRLASGDRSAIVLRYLEGRTAAEVGAAMQLSEEAAKKRVARALERLRKLAGSAAGVATVPAIEAILLRFNSPAPQPRVVAKAMEAGAGLAKGGQAAVIAREVIKMMIFKKLQIAALTLLAVVIVTGGTSLVLTRSNNRSIAAEPPATRPAPANPGASAQAKLDRLLPAVTFDGVGLQDVVNFLKDVSGVQIDVDWDALKQAGVSRNSPVSINFRDVRFGTALQMSLWCVADPGTLDYAVREGHIEISTAAALGLAKAALNTNADAQLLKRMARPKFPSARTLRGVVDYISHEKGYSIWVDWRQLKKAGIEQSAPADILQFEGLTLPAALDKLLGSAGPKANLKWTLRDGIILISTDAGITAIKALPGFNHQPR